MNTEALIFAFYAVGVAWQFHRSSSMLVKIFRGEDLDKPEAQAAQQAVHQSNDPAFRAGAAAAAVVVLSLMSLFWPITQLSRLWKKP